LRMSYFTIVLVSFNSSIPTCDDVSGLLASFVRINMHKA